MKARSSKSLWTMREKSWMLKRLIKVPSKVIIDTGPLLLFLTGNHDPDLISKIKRLRYRGGP
jgi:hypothetical protein